jgi:hypothetical protein
MVPFVAAVAVRVKVLRLKVATAERLAFMVIVQLGDVPVQAPDHPPNIEFASGAAVKVTTVPAEKVVADGLVVTFPIPVPAFVMVRI